MVDLHKNLVEALSSILPTYYEMTLTSQTETPCISYLEISNVAATDTHFTTFTIGYSRVNYQVKVWANSVADLQKYTIEIDKKLGRLGWKRTSCAELYDNNSMLMQKVLNYEALAKEEF